MKPEPTRREFGKRMVGLAAAPAVAAATPFAAAQEKPVDPNQALAESLAQVVRQRSGKHLTEEQMVLVKQSIVRRLAAADLLRKVKLLNGDEPAFRFHADPP